MRKIHFTDNKICVFVTLCLFFYIIKTQVRTVKSIE